MFNMNHNASREVVIIGGGIVGCATAYYLGKKGIKATIIERDNFAGHASGFALGELRPLVGAGIPDPMGLLSLESFRLHMNLSDELIEETNVDTDFQLHTWITAAYSEKEAIAMKSTLAWQQAQEGFDVEWMEENDVLSLERRLKPGLVGGIVTRPVALLDPYKLSLALLQASEYMGTTMRHGLVDGVEFRGDEVTAVRIGEEKIPCDAVVVAMGPWSGNVSSWVNVKVPVEPLKGQILRLDAGNAPSMVVSWGNGYAVSKPDGLVWIGTTEELVGFSESPTIEGRDAIMESVLSVLPHLNDASLVYQTSCLRPVSPDRLPILGLVPNKKGMVIATAGGRKGIHLGPIMGRIAADLVLQGETEFDISALALDRFGAGG